MSDAGNRIARILTCIIVICLGLLCVTDCSEPKPDFFSIRIQAQTESGEPLPGVRILENGESHGRTDETGMLFLQIRGFIGQKVTLSAICPEGYRQSSESRTISLRYLSGLNNERILSGPEVSWRCSSLVQTTAVVIRTSAQPNLPVAIDGKPVARTSADGIAHLLLKKTVGSHFVVSIDTSKYPDLRPQNPQRLFQIKERTAILIFDQRLTKAPKEKRRRKSKSATKRYVPYKIRD